MIMIGSHCQSVEKSTRQIWFGLILVVQAEQRSGRVGLAEYSVKNRDSLEILKRIEEQKKIISFVNDWKHFLEI